MSNAVERLCGREPESGLRPLRPFAPDVLDFLSALSAALLKDREAKAYPDVITFAYFCRKAHLARLEEEYAGRLDGRLGRGVVFHIAPSNVPINFAYSLTAALLSGNGSIVKASSRDFLQTRIVCRAMEKLLTEDFAPLAPYVCVVTYPREAQEVTEAFSARCDARVIWGGDETVCRVREAALPPRAVEVAFADRYSLLCIRPEAVTALSEEALERLAKDFYNDTYLTDQNACTSPRLIYWVGEGDSLEASERFFRAMGAYARQRYELPAVTAVDKLTAACRAAMKLEGAEIVPDPDNWVTRVRVKALCPELYELRSPGGFFLEYAAPTLDALRDFVTPRVQTLSYLGLSPEELSRFVLENGLTGVDRIVPVGHTMDFSLVWDGYDLIQTLSRKISAL